MKLLNGWTEEELRMIHESVHSKDSGADAFRSRRERGGDGFYDLKASWEREREAASLIPSGC